MTEPVLTPAPNPDPARSLDDDDTVRLHALTVSPNPVFGPGTSPVAVPGYEGLEEIGRGSMGVVYRARQVGLGRPVALKMILADTRADREALARFTSEARILASLQHPNIVQIYEIDLGHQPPYFSMELVEGGTLADRLGGRPQPARVAAGLVLTLARAVQTAHLSGIVHRDLKPGNVLLPAANPHGSAVGRMSAALGLHQPDLGHACPKITDFGLAKDLHAGADLTESGVIMGTPNYMAPEQAEGKSRDVGPAADVYSLGAILYEALTGRPPFTGESSMDTFLQIFHAEPVSPSRLQPRIPRDLETICLKCLHKVPGRRYPTAGELAGDLDRLLAGESILARPTPYHERAAKWARRRPALAASAACAVVAALGLAGAAAWHQVELQQQLGVAVADERDSRAAEAAAAERERLARLRGTANELVRDAEAALAANDWAGGAVPLARAREQVGDEVELADLRGRIDALRERADRQRGDHDRLEAFLDRRNDALFHATLFTGSTPAAAAHDTRAAATAALARFGVTPAAPGRPAVDSPFYTAAQKAEVVEGCYELLVVLAAACESATEAVRLLDQAATLGPPTRALHRRKAQSLARMGEAEAAEQELYRAGEYLPAVAAFEGALQLRPDHFWARYDLGLSWLKAGRPDQTVTCLTACLAQRRDFPWLYLLRGSAWAEQKQYDRAAADFDAALKGELTEAARYGLLVNRGVMRVRQGDPAAAEADLRAAVALRPTQYQGYLNLAQAHISSRKWDDALAQLNEAVKLEPGLPVLYRTRARLHLLRQSPDAALADFDEAVRLDPTADDQLERGRLLYARQDFAAALTAADAALTARPRDARASRLRAEALVALDRPADALRALDDCLAANPSDGGALRARAAVRTQLGEYPGAQADYTRALELAPDAATYSARGWCYLVAGAPRLAVPDFDEAVRRAPDLGDAYAGRGYGRALLGDQQAAAADAAEALARGPRTPRLCYNAARVYAQAVARLDRQAAFVGAGDAPRRAEWEDKAAQALAAALDQQKPTEAAAFWRTVAADRAFDAVRQGPGFARLAARYPAPPPAARVD